MLTEPTLDRLRALHLGAMADAYRVQLLITGATGVGKTYVACALGQHACRQEPC